MGHRWECIPADILMEILRRLPPSPRQRLRLICRHWRSVIDDRKPATQARAMVLTFVTWRGRHRAYVLDDLTEHGTDGGRELKLPRGAAGPGVSMVGTCNGLLCLRRCWDDDFLVVNPVTGETLAVPPPSESSPGASMELALDSFAYHPATGLYKIVRVPSSGAVKVFTLGDTSWRDVPVPVGTSRLLSFGLASIGGAMYWVAADSHSVMSLDLNDERVVFVATLPVRVGPHGLNWLFNLTTDLRGRLVVAVCSHEMKRTRMLKRIQTKVTKVWTLDDGGRRNKKRPAWVLRCKVVEPGQEPYRGIAWPHVTHGEHVLTTVTTGARGVNRVSLHACRIRAKRMFGGVVVRTEGSLSIGLYDDCHCLQTFAYVETTEPVAFYGGNDCDIGDSEKWGWRFDAEERRWKLMPHSTY